MSHVLVVHWTKSTRTSYGNKCLAQVPTERNCYNVQCITSNNTKWSQLFAGMLQHFVELMVLLYNCYSHHPDFSEVFSSFSSLQWGNPSHVSNQNLPWHQPTKEFKTESTLCKMKQKDSFWEVLKSSPQVQIEQLPLKPHQISFLVLSWLILTPVEKKIHVRRKFMYCTIIMFLGW